MPKTIDISTIADWNELDDYEKSDLIASIRKSGANVTGLDPKEVRELSLLGGYPDLPDMPSPPKAAMQKSAVPGLVQYGSSFAGGAIPGAKTGLALSGGNPLGAFAGGLVGGALSVGLDVGMDKLFKREPEGGNAANVVNAASGFIPGGKGLAAGMLRSGAEAATSAELNKLSGDKSASPLTAGLGGALSAGALNAVVKPFGERMRKVASEKDITDWLRARMGKGSAIEVGKEAQGVLDAADMPSPLLPESKPIYAEKLREIRERTGFDPVALTGEDRKTLKGLAGRPNDEVFKEILSPIFSAKKTDELPAAAESVRKGIDSLAKSSGKSREEFAKGLRKTFVQNVLGDDDIMNRPDSFRFRLEALGPDVVNELFSSAGRKGERSGAYHALMNLAEAATKEGGSFKVLLAPSGVTILEHLPGGVGKVAEKLLPKGGKSYALDTDNKLEILPRVGELLGIGAGAAAHPVAGLAAGAGVGAREGMRAAHFTWEKAIEKFAARSNRASDILRILASGEQRFSRPMINNFMNSLAKDADEKIGWD